MATALVSDIYLCRYVSGLSFSSNTAGVPSISEPINFTYFGDTYSLAYDPLNPVFNLTCVSTGCAAETVNWTRDGVLVHYDDNHTLSQTVTNMSTYENVLTVKGNEPGEYRCCVGNTRGNDCSQEFMLEGKAFSNTKCNVCII